MSKGSSGHKPNKHEQRKREKYRLYGRLKRNKIKNITKALITVSGKAINLLKERIDYWQNYQRN